MAYRLRYEAYSREGLIEERGDGRLYDEDLDDAENAWITLMFIDGELASTVRVNVSDESGAKIPSHKPFFDVVGPLLGAGRVIVDPTRLAAQLRIARAYPELPYLALRPGWMAGEHFRADFGVVSVVERHQPFYRRVFGYAPWCEPRAYPGFNFKVALMGLDFRAGKERVEMRHPFFRSTAAERESLFGSPNTTRIDRDRDDSAVEVDEAALLPEPA